MRFLVVETKSGDKVFTHFIELSKASIEYDFISFCDHLVAWKEEIVKVYFANSRLSNW